MGSMVKSHHSVFVQLMDTLQLIIVSISIFYLSNISGVVILGILAMNGISKTAVREENDYYATDPKAIDGLLRYETFNKNIWECACGEGNLSEPLKEYGYNVFSTDLIDRGYPDDIVDFLKTDIRFAGDIITNPPFKFTNEFILKALDSIPMGIRLLCS